MLQGKMRTRIPQKKKLNTVEENTVVSVAIDTEEKNELKTEAIRNNQQFTKAAQEGYLYKP